MKPPIINKAIFKKQFTTDVSYHFIYDYKGLYIDLSTFRKVCKNKWNAHLSSQTDNGNYIFYKITSNIRHNCFGDTLEETLEKIQECIEEYEQFIGGSI